MKCKNCQTDTSNPMFCSKSCSASYNNKHRTHSESTKKKVSEKLSIKYDEKHFLELYNSNLSIKEISKIIGIGKTTIYKIIKLMGIEHQKRITNKVVIISEDIPFKCINDISIEDFKIIVNKSSSITEILHNLGYSKNSGRIYKKIKDLIDTNDIDISHFKINTNIGRYNLNDILIENSPYKNTNSLKKRLIKENYIKNKCDKCGIGDKWNGLPLILQLDHINGKNRDNRLINLRLLCPNCHSQTTTFSGKNKKTN